MFAKTDIEAVFNSVRRVVKCQHEFLRAITRLYPEVAEDELLVFAPRSGEMQMEGDIWSYFKHGAGYRFINTAGGEIVEMHDHFLTPDIVDEWRIACHLQSTTDEDAWLDRTRLVLEFLAENDRLTRTNGGQIFRLNVD